jgi:DNA-binding transcriptional regulator YhcF (GntR family)
VVAHDRSMPRITLDPRSVDPAYKQIADQLRHQILSGELRPGDYLPAKPALAQELGISVTPVERAFKILKGEGLVVTKPGYRLMVAVPPPSRKRRRPPHRP